MPVGDNRSHHLRYTVFNLINDSIFSFSFLICHCDARLCLLIDTKNETGRHIYANERNNKKKFIFILSYYVHLWIFICNIKITVISVDINYPENRLSRDKHVIVVL
jgi:hypothetical protein